MFFVQAHAFQLIVSLAGNNFKKNSLWANRFKSFWRIRLLEWLAEGRKFDSLHLHMIPLSFGYFIS